MKPKYEPMKAIRNEATGNQMDTSTRTRAVEGITCIRKLKALGVIDKKGYDELVDKLNQVYPYNPLWALRDDSITPSTTQP